MVTDPNSQILNTLVRMVMPMRREFGRQLDVQQFLRDGKYAQEVLDEASKSQDPRLVEYANYVARRLHGPRVTEPAAAPPRLAASPKPAASSEPAAATSSQAATLPAPPVDGAPMTSEEEMRARVLKKYTGGLR